MSDEATLLLCPICGKKVSIARTENEVGERWWFITRGTYKTTRCNCRLFLESEKFTCGWNDDYSLECRAKLIDKWNTRTAHGTLTAEQVSKAVEGLGNIMYNRLYEDWQAVADELIAELNKGNNGECYLMYKGKKYPAELDFGFLGMMPITITVGGFRYLVEVPNGE